MRNLNYHIVLVVVLLFAMGCDVRDNEFEPEKRFTKVYDDSDYDANFYPLDISQTTDGGYLVLAVKGVWDPYLMKVDGLGEKVWEIHLTSPYSNPVPKLLKQNSGAHFFFCMNDNGLNQTYLMRVDENAGTVSEVAFLDEITYPLSSSVTPDNGFILQGYNADKRSSTLSKFGSGGNEQWTESYNIFEDLEVPAILYHITRVDPPLPFFCGTLESQGGTAQSYYFNGFANYNFAMTFVATGDGAQQGTIQGNRYEAAVSSAIQVSGNDFAVSRFEEDGSNFLAPRATIDPTTFSQSTALEGELFKEVANKTIIKSELLDIDGGQYIAYAATSRSGKIILQFYDVVNGNFSGAETFGLNQLYQIGELIQTSDGGLAILGMTTLEGQFDRLVIFKLSKEDLAGLVK